MYVCVCVNTLLALLALDLKSLLGVELLCFQICFFPCNVLTNARHLSACDELLIKMLLFVGVLW